MARLRRPPSPRPTAAPAPRTPWRLGPEIRFLLAFALAFGLGMGLYQLTNLWNAGWLGRLNAEAAAWVVNTFGLGQAQAQGRLLSMPQGSVSIEKGCEGVEAILLLAAALLAYPQSWRRRGLGLALGAALLLVVNLARTVALLLSQAHFRALFDILHIYVGQTAIILVGLFFFLAWIGPWTTPSPTGVAS